MRDLIRSGAQAGMAQHRVELTEAVQRGDILMVHAGYWQANNPVVVQIYKDAVEGKR